MKEWQSSPLPLRIFGKIGEVAKESYTGLSHFISLLKERVTLEAREFLLQWRLRKAMHLNDMPRKSVRGKKKRKRNIDEKCKIWV